MQEAAKMLEFEHAAILRDQIKKLREGNDTGWHPGAAAERTMDNHAR